MRSTTLLSLALAASPIVVSAAGTLGFALGDKKADGSCKFTQDYEEDFDALKASTSIVRTYSASECNTAQQILPAAAAKGFKVMLGVWPDVDDAYNADKAALQSALSSSSNKAAVYAITVGSEALYRGSLTAPALLTKINDMKKTFPDVLVGTADSWNKFQDGTADPIIQGGVKLILANAFSYWQAQELSNSTHSYLDDLFQAFAKIQSAAGTTNIEVWNGETGWPADGGSNYGAAIAGTKNAASYFQSAVCGALGWGFNVFMFEAFDEPWKPASIGDDGKSADETHWGAFTADRKAKYATSC